MFDLKPWGPTVARCGRVVVKVWVNDVGWKLLVQADVDLSQLTFVGKSVSLSVA